MTEMMLDTTPFGQRFNELRAPAGSTPDLAVVIPVNARSDLGNVFMLLGDLARYQGSHTIELLLVVNNFDSDKPPMYIPQLEAHGLRIVAVPNVRRKGMAVALAGRMHGIRAASCDAVLSFDADCRVPDATALLDWYVQAFRHGADAAYTFVGHYDVRPGLSIKARILSHHLARWGKRAIFRIPTTRGGNYAVRKSVVVPLYDDGYIADELNVGPVVKKHGGTIRYSNARRLRVLTSGRAIRQNWGQLKRYLWYRLRYNMRTLPTGQDAAERTHRS